MSEGTVEHEDELTVGTVKVNIPGSVKEMRLLNYGKSIVGIEIPTKDMERLNFNMPVNIIGERVEEVPVEERKDEGFRKPPQNSEGKLKTVAKLAKRFGINPDKYIKDQEMGSEGSVIEETYPELKADDPKTDEGRAIPEIPKEPEGVSADEGLVTAPVKEAGQDEAEPSDKRSADAIRVSRYESGMREKGFEKRPCSKCGKKRWGKKTVIPKDHVCRECEGTE